MHSYDEYEDEYGRISTRLYDPVRGFSPSGAFQPEREVPPHTSSKGQARHVTHASTHSRIFPTAEAAAAAAAVTSTPASAHGTPASAAHSVRMVDGGAPSPGPAAGGGPQGKGLSRWTKRRPFGEPLPASDIPTPATCNRLRRRVERAKLAQAASKEVRALLLVCPCALLRSQPPPPTLSLATARSTQAPRGASRNPESTSGAAEATTAQPGRDMESSQAAKLRRLLMTPTQEHDYVVCFQKQKHNRDDTVHRKLFYFLLDTPAPPPAPAPPLLSLASSALAMRGSPVTRS